MLHSIIAYNNTAEAAEIVAKRIAKLRCEADAKHIMFTDWNEDDRVLSSAVKVLYANISNGAILTLFKACRHYDCEDCSVSINNRGGQKVIEIIF